MFYATGDDGLLETLTAEQQALSFAVDMFHMSFCAYMDLHHEDPERHPPAGMAVAIAIPDPDDVKKSAIVVGGMYGHKTLANVCLDLMNASEHRINPGPGDAGPGVAREGDE